MSNVINPEHECPFDPKHYQCDCFIAPVGSFSWALIQLKLRKRVARSVWGDKGVYLAITPRVNDLTVEESSAYAVDGVAVGTKYDYLTHIDLRNEHGNFVPWQPTQEDMMACDWKFMEEKEEPVKPEPKPKPESDDNMLVFDITLGSSTFNINNDEYQDWGYLSNKGLRGSGQSTFGTLILAQNITDVKDILMFYVTKHGSVYSRISSEKDNYQKVEELIKKNLYVTVDDVTYNLGDAKITSKDAENHTITPEYSSTDAQKLGEVLKQTGQTKRFYCNWR
ncbi:DUF2829 domain-containing protein [Xenorhabdus bovienii]|uniref:DUF2829 domain-containing protein n=1 Tax=Xenorhabdus bovienii TaxID=40576 RepID=UPI003DA4C69C